jgi:FO synthase
MATIEAAGKLKIPFTSGVLVGIGESERDRIAALERLAEVHERYGHLQEVILQNFVPHQRYYGREPAEIADSATDEYWRTGVWNGPHRDAPSWACEVTIEDMKALVAEARRLLPGVGIQVPPNLSDWWLELVRAGATEDSRPMVTTSHPSTHFHLPRRCAAALRTRGLP